jgi:TrmH family RNA methyltransferase
MHSQIRRFAALLNAVRDPGNLGAIIRTAEASGCEWIACSRDCADPFQPKSVRASMGSIFRVPAFKVHDLDGFVADQRGRNVNVVALHPRNGADLPSIHPVAPSLIVIGGETAGIPGTIEVDTWIRIPMKGKVESLNTAVAASLCFYHFASGSA